MSGVGRGKGIKTVFGGGKRPMLRIHEEDDNDDDDENSSSDPANAALAKLLAEEKRLEKKRERTETLFVARFSKKWREEYITDPYVKFVGKMMHAMQKNVNVNEVRVMRLLDFQKFKMNRIENDETFKLFEFDMKRGQRTKTVDTLKTISIYGQLLFVDDVDIDQGPFRHPVSDDKLTIQIYIEGCEWEDQHGFYEFMRFIQHYSGKRGAHQDEDDDGDLGDFTTRQVSMIRNQFLDILIEYFKGLCRELNHYFIPKDNYVTGRFIAACLREYRQ